MYGNTALHRCARELLGEHATPVIVNGIVEHVNEMFPESDKPEKPKRHWILDDSWTKTEMGRLIDSNGRHIMYNGREVDLLKHFPRLVRTLEKHHTGYWASSCKEEVEAVLADMGIVFGE